MANFEIVFFLTGNKQFKDTKLEYGLTETHENLWFTFCSGFLTKQKFVTDENIFCLFFIYYKADKNCFNLTLFRMLFRVY